MGWLLNRALANAVHVGDPVRVVEFLQDGADVNARDKFGNPLLTAAVAKNHLLVAQALISARADVNAKSTCRQHPGYTALHFAACSHFPEYISLLVQNGAKINARNDQGQTPYELALALNYTEQAERLQLYAGR